MTVRVTAPDLQRFIAAVLEASGMASEHAGQVADALVWANLRGVDTHGVVRLPRYLEMIDQGIMNPRPDIRIKTQTASTILVEAGRAPGPAALAFALDHVIAKAKSQGIAMAVVSQMTHSGALGYYTQQAAAAQLACLALNAGTPFMPYHGARGAVLGTNPISIAVPGGDDDPLIFDMATSAISNGRLLQARRSGTPLEPGWAVDDAGRPTLDAAAAAMTLPLGGPKGAGLALMMECLASLLAGNPLVADAIEGRGEGARHRQNAVLIVIDIAVFIDLARFRDEIGRLVAALKSLPLAPGFDVILMPGERGFRMRKEREAAGIPLPPAVTAEVKVIAGRLGIAMPAAP
jgi:LDH2 family malate/lactate/ureidoglycolate dehydrogenase